MMELHEALAAALAKGHELHQQGYLENAEKIYRRILQTAPDHADAVHLLGLSLHQQGRSREALPYLERAVAMRPGIVEYRRNLGAVRRAGGDLEGALEALQEAVRVRPGDPDGHLALGVELIELGRFGEAEAELQECLRIDPGKVKALAALVQCQPSKESRAALLERILDRLSDPALPEEDAIALHFAAGKLLESERRYEESFRHVDAGNRLERARFTYSAADHERYVDDLIATFDRAFFARAAALGGGIDTELPLFIVGVPRSGTTLVEQIVSSHPRVFGAGELEEIGRLAQGTSDPVERMRWPSRVAAMDAATATANAEAYLAEIERRAPPGMARVTDKMPTNFLYLGFIARIFPRARIIHCRRDPMDSCLSMLSMRFAGSHPYAYDQRELGLWHRQYQRLMAHWREVLPLPMLEVDYERMVESQEEESRRLLEFCGLEWDDRCLEFYRSERPIQTASVWQARQPMYRSSAGRWRRYEPWLGALKEALEG